MERAITSTFKMEEKQDLSQALKNVSLMFQGLDSLTPEELNLLAELGFAPREENGWIYYHEDTDWRIAFFGEFMSTGKQNIMHQLDKDGFPAYQILRTKRLRALIA